MRVLQLSQYLQVAPPGCSSIAHPIACPSQAQARISCCPLPAKRPPPSPHTPGGQQHFLLLQLCTKGCRPVSGQAGSGA